jgi:hypothetical protein
METPSNTTRTLHLERDPDFQALYRPVCSVGASILRSGAALTTAQKHALIADLKSQDSARAKAALASMGISQNVIYEQKRLVSILVARHSLPQDPAQLRPIIKDAVTAAAKLSYSDGSGPAPDPLDEILDELDLPDPSGGSGSDTCGNCAVEAAVSLAFYQTDYVMALWACTFTGPGWPICVAAATGGYAWALYQVDKSLKSCLATCG